MIKIKIKGWGGLMGHSWGAHGASVGSCHGMTSWRGRDCMTVMARLYGMRV
jgi:hypothetical protein